MISHLVRASVLASVCVAALATESSARTPYDGSWSVLIVTTRGECDRAYRYGVSIVDGHIRYAGGIVNMQGRVSANGRIRVMVSSGSGYASGSGRLNRNSGGGNWSGASGPSRCSGYWQASRSAAY
jgi:hypothetical protein